MATRPIKNVTQLTNPRNDAADLAHGLQQVGFEVQLLNDLDFDGLRRALRDFSDRATGAEMALVYYAGHGIEVAKQNYLIPVDARFKTDRDVQFEAVPLDFVLSAVEGAKSLRLVLLDACRNNPFAGFDEGNQCQQIYRPWPVQYRTDRRDTCQLCGQRRHHRR